MTNTASILLIKDDAPKEQLQTTQKVRAALIDLYNGEANLGIQSIKNEVDHWGRSKNIAIELDQHETRRLGTAPDLSYDFYISSGGPGSPFEGKGKPWETAYFNWLDAIWRHNTSPAVQAGELAPKYVFFICHSFQMMCRHFELGQVTRRGSQSFGVFKTHQTEAGLKDPLFKGLQDPFYVADFRDWQVVQPNTKNLQDLGASIIALEKIRPHVPLERAMMGIRISPHLVGVQFHPEAEPDGMLLHFKKDKRRDAVIEEHGEEKFNQIISRLQDPGFLLHTFQTILPNFMRNAI